MNLLGFVPTNSKFVPASIRNYALSQGKYMKNKISQFLINVDYIPSTYNNSQTVPYN